jgi:AcrR family transcriptional regulator
LARVAHEGFRLLREALERAITEAHAVGSDPLEEMAGAYVGFAAANGPHYRTMFGRPSHEWGSDPGLISEANATFTVLVEAIADQQKLQRIAPGDPLRLAKVIWPVVHGIASLGLDGHLSHNQAEYGELENLAKFAWRSLRDGIKADR